MGVGWGRKGVVPKRQEKMSRGDVYVVLDCHNGFPGCRIDLNVSSCRLEICVVHCLLYSQSCLKKKGWKETKEERRGRLFLQALSVLPPQTRVPRPAVKIALCPFSAQCASLWAEYKLARDLEGLLPGPASATHKV